VLKLNRWNAKVMLHANGRGDMWWPTSDVAKMTEAYNELCQHFKDATPPTPGPGEQQDMSGNMGGFQAQGMMFNTGMTSYMGGGASMPMGAQGGMMNMPNQQFSSSGMNPAFSQGMNPGMQPGLGMGMQGMIMGGQNMQAPGRS